MLVVGSFQFILLEELKVSVIWILLGEGDLKRSVVMVRDHAV